MPQIIPIRDLKNTSEISERCHAVGEPTFVTKNGYGDMVVISIEAYEARMQMLDIYAKLATAQDHVKNDQVLSATEALKGLREKYGL